MPLLPEWMTPPRAEGWYAEDLDHLPEAPKHTELMHGAFVFRHLPEPQWHDTVLGQVAAALEDQASKGGRVAREVAVRLDRRNRPEPDLLVTTRAYEEDRTWFAPEDVQLVVEVVSPESAHRDRTVKLRKYAEAGIPHYWCIEDEGSRPVVHVYELDGPTRTYVPAGIFRGSLKRPVPFDISLDLDALTP